MSTDPAAAHAVDSLPAPAAQNVSQARKRPVRTYSRRSAGTRVQEQEVPLNVTTPEPRTTDLDQGRAESRPPLPVPPEKKRAERPSRGSILAYFKPLPESSDKPLSDVASSDPAESLSTPPTSPEPASRLRKRRRLTTRPQFDGLAERSLVHGEGLPQDDQASANGAGARPRRSMSMGQPTTAVSSESLHTPRPALSEVAANTVDHQDGLASVVRRRRSRGSTEKRPRRDMTQTTLSLSVQKEPGFTICGVCDLLYNPLNEKDRREHNRRHAAYSRSKKRAAV